LVHRDIKPSNIRIDREGEPHILDFGLAKNLGGGVADGSSATVSLPGEFMGTLAWASPEQIEGVPNKIDPRTDVYSLGVVLFQMLTERFPYEVFGGFGEVADRIRNAEPRSPSAITKGVDSEIDTIVLKCLAKDPERRYADAGEVARDIRHYLAGEPIEAKADSSFYRLRKRLHRHAMTIGLVVALLVVGVVAIASTLTAWRTGQTSDLGPSPQAEVHPEIAAFVDHTGETVHGETYFANALRGIPEYSSFPANLAIGHGDGPGNHAVGSDESLAVDGVLYIGYGADGRLEITDGGTVSNQSAHIGDLPGSAGHVVVTGSQSSWTTRHTLVVGCDGEGRLEVRDGASVSGIAARIGKSEGGIGVVVIDGSNSTWEYGVDVDAGFAGDGNLTIQNGGTTRGGYGHVAVEPASIGEVTIVGPGSTWVTHASLYVGGHPGVPGGRGRVLLGDGGTLQVHHTLKIWTGGVVELAGGLLYADTVDHTEGGSLEFAKGRLFVNLFRGDLVNEGGVFGAAHSPGTIEVTGDYTQDAGALELRLHGSGFDEHDTLIVTGTAALGGELRVVLAAGFVPGYEDRFVVLSADTVTGTFDRDEVWLAGGGSCVASFTGTEVVLTGFEGPFHSEDGWADPSPRGPLPRPHLPKGSFPCRLSQNTTGEHDLIFLGPPDNIGMGIAGQIVEFDFGDLRVVDGEGPDFNVYETDVGTPEHGRYDVLVSQDGEDFRSVKAAWDLMVRIPGDEAHAGGNHAESLDLEHAGLSRVRYIRIDGVGDGVVRGLAGFDLDAIGAIHLAPADELPTTLDAERP
jgi:T5SS/PEP-CTERM-associated repeat protein